MKNKILILLILISTINTLHAQHHQQFYFKLDLESGNIWSCAALAGVSAGLNAVTHRDFSINAFTINKISAEPNVDVEDYQWNKTTANDLFKDLQTGIRIGAKTDNGSFVNVGFYTSFHYKINQFKLEDLSTKNYEKHNVHRALFGLTALMQLGGNDKDFLGFVEAGARYAVATKYDNPYKADKSALNNGIISHWALHFSPNGNKSGMQDIGFFVDVNHYNLLKNNAFSHQSLDKIKMITFGISFAVTPGQANNR